MTDLLEVEAVGDVIGSHEASEQMGDSTSLTTVRPEQESVHAPLSGKQHRFYFMEGTKNMDTHTHNMTNLRSWLSTAMLAYM